MISARRHDMDAEMHAAFFIIFNYSFTYFFFYRNINKRSAKNTAPTAPNATVKRP